jgi:hypothetical protein
MKKKTELEILTHLQVLGPPEYEKVVIGMPSVFMYVCVNVCMVVLLASAYSYLVFMSLYVIGRYPEKMNVLAQKIGAL